MIETSGGPLTINGNVSANGDSILILDQDTNAGSISIQSHISTLVSASSPSTNGQITIAIVSQPVSAVNPGQANFPSSITVIQNSPGEAFAGDTTASLIGPNSGTATVNAARRNVIFSSPAAANTITLEKLVYGFT